MDAQLRKLVENFYQPVEMPGGWQFDHVDTLKTNALYYNSQFKTGKYDGNHRKFFYNIIKPACDVARKFIDLDTKDLNLHPTSVSVENLLYTWAMEKRLKQWLKDNKFGVTINRIVYRYPMDGHIVVKKVKGKYHLVPLTNMRTHNEIESLEKMPEFAEKHTMSRAQIESNKNWKKDKVAELLDRDGEDFTVYETYVRDGKGWKLMIKADPFCAHVQDKGFIRSQEADINTEDDYLPSVELFEGKVSKLPYYELKWEEVEGRWLGRGFAELLQDAQIAANETENLSRKGLALSALALFQTRDDAIGGQNVFRDAENGDIITVEQELSKVPMEERNLPAYNADRMRWDENTRSLTFTFDSGTGETLPSRTPLGSHSLSVQMVQSFYDGKRENLGMFLKDLIEDIIPEFKNDNAKEHALIFGSSDNDINRLNRLEIDVKLKKMRYDHAMKTGFFPSEYQMEEARLKLEDQLKKNKQRTLKLPDHAYDNAKYNMDIVVTGESVNIEKQNAAMEMFVNMLNSNPAVMQVPELRSMMLKWVSGNAISPVDLEMLNDANMSALPTQQGGSLARPQQGGTAPQQMTQQM